MDLLANKNLLQNIEEYLFRNKKISVAFIREKDGKVGNNERKDKKNYQRSDLLMRYT